MGGRSADPRGLHGGSGSVPPAAPLQPTPSLQSGEAELAAGVPHLPPPASERSLGSSAPGPQDEEGPGSPAPRSSGLQPTGWWVSLPFTCLCTNGRGGWTPLRPLRGLQETRVPTREESGVLGHFHFSFHALGKEMPAHSSVLAWRIPGTGEPGGLPSMGWHRVGHD